MRRLGRIPAWAWVLVGGLAVAGFVLYERRQAARQAGLAQAVEDATAGEQAAFPMYPSDFGASPSGGGSNLGSSSTSAGGGSAPAYVPQTVPSRKESAPLPGPAPLGPPTFKAPAMIAPAYATLGGYSTPTGSPTWWIGAT